MRKPIASASVRSVKFGLPWISARKLVSASPFKPATLANPSKCVASRGSEVIAGDNATSAHVLLIKSALEMKFDDFEAFFFGTGPGNFSKALTSFPIDIHQLESLDPLLVADARIGSDAPTGGTLSVGNGADWLSHGHIEGPMASADQALTTKMEKLAQNAEYFEQERDGHDLPTAPLHSWNRPVDTRELRLPPYLISRWKTSAI